MSLTDTPTPPSPDADRRARTSGPLQLEMTADATTFLVVLHGECDLSSLTPLRAAFQRAVASDCPEVVVDLEFCTFIDSTGIGALLGLNRSLARVVGRDLRILPGPPVVQRVFAICDLLDILPFEDA